MVRKKWTVAVESARCEDVIGKSVRTEGRTETNCNGGVLIAGSRWSIGL